MCVWACVSVRETEIGGGEGGGGMWGSDMVCGCVCEGRLYNSDYICAYY